MAEAADLVGDSGRVGAEVGDLAWVTDMVVGLMGELGGDLVGDQGSVA